MIRTLANEADRGIPIGGVVDRDFLAARDIQKTEQEEGVHVLAVHEVENFFLDPETVKQLQLQNGHSSLAPHELVLSAADAKAGNWIFQYAMATDQGSSLAEINNGMKSRIKQYTWQAIDSDQEAFVTEIDALSRFDATEASKLKSLLEIGVRAYARKRELDRLWKQYEGKQVLNGVALAIGFSDARMLSTAAFALWERGTVPVPAELQLLSAYLSQR